MSGTCDKDGHAVDEGTSGLEDLFYIPLGGLFAAHGQVIDDDVCARGFEDFGDVNGVAFGFCDDLVEVFAQSIVGHAAVNGNVEVGNIGKFDGVVGMGKDGFAQVFAHFFRIDVKGCGKFNVADVIAAQVGVHQSGDEIIFRSVFVVFDALYEGGCTVACADDGDSDFGGHDSSPWVKRVYKILSDKCL